MERTVVRMLPTFRGLDDGAVEQQACHTLNLYFGGRGIPFSYGSAGMLCVW